MRTTILILLATLCCAPLAHADAPDQQAALHFMDDYYAALKHRDLGALTAMIAPDAPIVVLLNDGGEQKFTFSRAEYLQQIHAVWHFATEEKYDIKNISYHPAVAGGPALVTLQDDESRTVLGNPSGQRNQLEISLSENQGTIRIVAIKSHTMMW